MQYEDKHNVKLGEEKKIRLVARSNSQIMHRVPNYESIKMTMPPYSREASTKARHEFEEQAFKRVMNRMKIILKDKDTKETDVLLFKMNLKNNLAFCEDEKRVAIKRYEHEHKVKPSMDYYNIMSIEFWDWLIKVIIEKDLMCDEVLVKRFHYNKDFSVDVE